MSVFDEELQHLNKQLLRMGLLVEEAIRDAIHAIVERDNAVARRAIENDTLVDRLDVDIDEECIRLIALRQPKAGDLRLITMAMKITTDLERMGDLAVNIAERAVELNEEPVLKPYIDIPKMSEIVQGMTREALDSFVQKDKKLATAVIMRDDAVDKLKHDILRELEFFMTQDPSTVSRAMKVSYVATYLERIADHATNIAEMVIYLLEGKIIRHREPHREG
jgi:phosphate transport system protein